MNNSRETEQNRKERDSNQIKQGTETRYHQQTTQGRKDTHKDRQRKKRPFISRNKLIALSVLVMLYCLLNLAGRIFIGPKHVPGTKGVEVYGIDEAGKRRIEEHLKEKYGEEFVCDKAYHNTSEFPFERVNFGENYEVYAKKDKDRMSNYKFMVKGYNYKGTKSGYEYRDGYFAVQSRENYRQYIEDIAHDIFDKEFYVGVKFYNDWVYNNQITNKTSMCDIFEITKEDIYYLYPKYIIWVSETEISNEQEMDKKSLEFAKQLKNNKLCGIIDIYVIRKEKEKDFLKHKNYLLNRIDTFEEYAKYYLEGGEYARYQMQEGVYGVQKLSEELMDEKYLEYVYGTKGVAVIRSEENPGEIKIVK